MDTSPRQRLACLPPVNLEEGMVLADCVRTKQGAMLLPADAVLDEQAIGQLRRRGVDCVTVRIADPRDDETAARETAAAQARVDHIFRGTGSGARSVLHAAISTFRQRTA